MTSLIDHNLGGKRGESVVQSEHKFKLSRNGVFFWYQISGCVVFREIEPDGDDPEGWFEIRSFIAECHQTTRGEGEERVLQPRVKH
jgi:hypothetical protein